MIVINFKPKNSTKNLISELPDRARDIVIGRFGLGSDAEKKTLESIGQEYGITRERVRQIENSALNKIRQSEAYEKEQKIFEELHSAMQSLGVIVPEETLFSNITNKQDVKNHIHFLLVIGDPFMRETEDKHFYHRWHVDEQFAGKVHDAIKTLVNGLTNDDLVSEADVITAFSKEIKKAGIPQKQVDKETLLRWLDLSKNISKNPLGEYGRSSSPNIKVKGMRDYAYLVIRQHGSPMHFTEVTKQISKLFGKKAHVATTHNELIKDQRFVLVGRGLYALSSWGYMTGVVKDVLKQILDQHGPLTKKEIIDKVLKERYVKDNTIIVNLQNPRHFKKLSDGRYTIA